MTHTAHQETSVLKQTRVQFNRSKGNCKMNIPLSRQVNEEKPPIMIHA